MDYYKIVRDKIPQIIEAQGKKCKYSTEETSEISHIPALYRKLNEEVNEFQNSMFVDDELEELADIIEVCYTIAKHFGKSEEELNSIRYKKVEEKGGFNDLVMLETVED